MATDRRCESQREKGDCQPRTQVGLYPSYLAALIELENHRVSEFQRPDASITHDHPHVACPDLIGPPQIGEAAVDGSEENAEITASPEHHAARDRRDEFDVRGEDFRKGVDVVHLAGDAIAGYGVFHEGDYARAVERHRKPVPSTGAPSIAEVPRATMASGVPYGPPGGRPATGSHLEHWPCGSLSVGYARCSTAPAASARVCVRARVAQLSGDAVAEFITGDLLRQPRRVGTPLQRELKGRRAAHRGSYRVLYAVDDEAGVGTVLSAEHRRDVYRRP